MPDIRAELSQKNKWWIPKHAFYTAYHYALQYDDWKREYASLDGGVGAVKMDGMPHSTDVGDPTPNIGIRRAELADKMRLIEDTVKEVDAILYPWLIVAVTKEDINYNYLQTMMRIPCGKNMYYNKRRQFYYILSKRMGG